jgi:FG-GAP-like repeat
MEPAGIQWLMQPPAAMSSDLQADEQVVPVCPPGFFAPLPEGCLRDLIRILSVAAALVFGGGVAAQTGSVPREAFGLKSQAFPGGPDAQTWDTEAFSEAAGMQLKKAAAMLGSSADATGVSGLLAAGFVSTALRPAKLAEFFADGSLRVRRGKPPPPAALDAGAWAAALNAMKAPLPGAEEVHVLTKIYSVDSGTEFPETLVRVECTLKSGGHAVSQTSRWRCRWLRPKKGPPLLRSVSVEDFEEVEHRATTPAFADDTGRVLGRDPAFRDQLAWSLDHWMARVEKRFLHSPAGWEGFALGDANGDGLDDLYVCQPGGLPDRLFLQNADGTLTDRSRDAGTDWWDGTTGVVWVDFDNDGDQDLAVGCVWGVMFLQNDGKAHFTAASTKLLPEGAPYSLAAADYDGDGDTDLYACCYTKRPMHVEYDWLALPIPWHDAENGSRNVLLRNDRDFSFRDVTRAVGLDVNNRRFSFAAAWSDYDGDGDLDLYVANDFGRNNLYRCDRTMAADGVPDITFTDVAAAAGVEDISAGMSAAWGDPDNNGRPDLYVGNMWSSAGNRVAYQRRFRESAGRAEKADYQRHAHGNSLFMNDGGGKFSDASEPAAVTVGRWAWGSRFVDLNADGWEDLIVANGYITQQRPEDL